MLYLMLYRTCVLFGTSGLRILHFRPGRSLNRWAK